MKEWMAFQGFEDILPPNSWISLQRPRWKDGQICAIHQHRGETNLSLSTCGIQPFPALSLGQGIHQQTPNAYTKGCLGQPDQGRISTMEDSSRSL